jgi:hypothetical protein
VYWHDAQNRNDTLTVKQPDDMQMIICSLKRKNVHFTANLPRFHAFHRKAIRPHNPPRARNRQSP